MQIRRPQLSILGQSELSPSANRARRARSSADLVLTVDSHFLPGVSLQYLASDEYGASNNLTNVDGFGVGWYSEVPARYAACAEEVDEGLAELQPTVYRCDKPPHHDTNLISLCKTLDSSTIFAHLRAGSTLAVSNNHPFQFGKYLIMHNGSIASELNLHGVLRALIEAGPCSSGSQLTPRRCQISPKFSRTSSSCSQTTLGPV